jgi:hypothetical protein
MRRRYLVEKIPSKPGTISRSGNPCWGRTASPFIPQHTRQSSIALASGMLDAPFTSSAPSATNQDAPPFTPHSLSSVERSTPVHSAQLVIPCDSCTVLALAVARLPAHSMK